MADNKESSEAKRAEMRAKIQARAAERLAYLEGGRDTIDQDAGKVDEEDNKTTSSSDVPVSNAVRRRRAAAARRSIPKSSETVENTSTTTSTDLKFSRIDPKSRREAAAARRKAEAESVGAVEDSTKEDVVQKHSSIKHPTLPFSPRVEVQTRLALIFLLSLVWVWLVQDPNVLFKRLSSKNDSQYEAYVELYQQGLWTQTVKNEMIQKSLDPKIIFQEEENPNVVGFTLPIILYVCLLHGFVSAVFTVIFKARGWKKSAYYHSNSMINNSSGGSSSSGGIVSMAIGMITNMLKQNTVLGPVMRHKSLLQDLLFEFSLVLVTVVLGTVLRYVV